MTPTRAWTVASACDAALARSAVARLAAAAGMPTVERARLLAGLSARLRRCLEQPAAAWQLVFEVICAPPHGETGRFRLSLRPTGQNRSDASWQTVVECPDPEAAAREATQPDVPLAEALLLADDDTAALLDHLDEQERLVSVHREELHQTNQGVLALHAELDAADRTQRELLAAEKAARAEAEGARHRLTFLADASAALTASLSHREILRRLPELLVPQHARTAEVWLFDDDGPDTRAPHPAAAVVAARTGRPQYAADHPGHLPGVENLPPSALAPNVPLLCLPLTARRSTLGVLTLTAPGDRFDRDNTVMLIELARRAGIAIDHALRYEHNRDIAETLQRTLLTELPVTAGLQLAARYLPATHGLNIGGDWYDAFAQPDGSLIAVIGDVTGHGLHAAVMMGQLRNALRAYAVDGDSPGRLLTRLHHFLHHLEPDLCATAAIARFRPGDPTVTWAAAGHPPPVVRTCEGRVRVLDAKPGAMLGIPLGQGIKDHTVELPPGSTLALYTDGLVERRRQGIDPGIARLGAVLAGLGSAELARDLDGAAEAVLGRMLHDCDREDDVCLLLCHTGSEPVVTPAAPDPHRRPRQPAANAPGPQRSATSPPPTSETAGEDANGAWAPPLVADDAQD
ncbi:PP2C family protein-serine/threonine phosphatase [Streptantibioticus rubrisoli]|uniref:SpoIIE family protein phosphatase n=1 Tax=Streptantibioticus rubrisoli TaxID=1387313 RepID=A0ABT1P6U0_9ACTN|nr:GAF domain-containing SpoIIE family protein phosphatase [Streptantibioticus rubrisoli]MCQ4041089.1 SpoIIE family protein phosphatase [Streptantibioticus rubrisoli]